MEKILWKVKTGGAFSRLPASSGKNVVYVKDRQNNLYAISKENGTLIWKYSIGVFGPDKNNIIDDKVYVKNENGGLSVFAKDTGELIFSYDEPLDIDSLFVSDLVYVKDKKGGLLALSKDKGELIQRYNISGRVIASSEDPPVLYIMGDDELQAISKEKKEPIWTYECDLSLFPYRIDAHNIYIINVYANIIEAVSKYDGTLKWKYRTKELVYPEIKQGKDVLYLIDYETIYMVSKEDGTLIKKLDGEYFITKKDIYLYNDKEITKISKDTGEIKWKHKVELPIEKLVAKDDILFVVSITEDTGHLYILSEENGSLLWKKDMDIDLDLSLGVYGDTIYLQNEGHLYALGKKDGSPKWKTPLDIGLDGFLGIEKDTLYINDSENVYVIQGKDGKTLWHHTHSEKIVNPLSADDEFVYIQDKSGTLTALSREDGKPKWTYEVDGTITSKMKVFENTIYVSGQNGYLYAIDREKGKLKWRIDTDSDTPSIAVDNENIYMYNGLFLYIISKDGNVKWASSPIGKSGPLFLSGENLYIPDDSEGIEIRDKHTGKIKKELKIKGIEPETLVLSGDNLYVQKERFIYAFSKEGDYKWKYKVKTRYDSFFFTAFNDTLYISTFGKVYSVKWTGGILKKAKIEWEYKEDELFDEAPIVDGNTLYINGISNLYKLDRKTGRLMWTFDQYPIHILSSVPLSKAIYTVSPEGIIHKIDKENGTLIEKYEIRINTKIPPIISDNTIYIGGEDGYLYAV